MGWAGINYGYANSFEHMIEKLQHDLFYNKNMSWILDALIILETVKTVLVKKGSLTRYLTFDCSGRPLCFQNPPLISSICDDCHSFFSLFWPIIKHID